MRLSVRYPPRPPAPPPGRRAATNANRKGSKPVVPITAISKGSRRGDTACKGEGGGQEGGARLGEELLLVFVQRVHLIQNQHVGALHLQRSAAVGERRATKIASYTCVTASDTGNNNKKNNHPPSIFFFFLAKDKRALQTLLPPVCR